MCSELDPFLVLFEREARSIAHFRGCTLRNCLFARASGLGMDVPDVLELPLGSTDSGKVWRFETGAEMQNCKSNLV